MTGRPNTRHLILRRTLSGRLYNRHHSYKKKSDAKAAAKSLKSKGWLARVYVTKGEEYQYTVYKRRKR